MVLNGEHPADGPVLDVSSQHESCRHLLYYHGSSYAPSISFRLSSHQNSRTGRTDGRKAHEHFSQLACSQIIKPYLRLHRQSSQYLGMCQKMYQTSKSFREHLDSSFEEICKQLALHRSSRSSPVIPQKTRTPTHTVVCSQWALGALEIALALPWLSWGLVPKAIVGHSLGVYAAFCIAGVLTIRDTFYLVGTRARLVAQRCKSGSHAMLAIRMPTEQLNKNLGGTGLLVCEVACINGLELTVVSGPNDQLDELHHELSSRSWFLQSRLAFHSAQMETILEDLGGSCSRCQIYETHLSHCIYTS